MTNNFFQDKGTVLCVDEKGGRHSPTAFSKQKLTYSYDNLNRQIARSLATGVPFVTEYTYEGKTGDGSVS